ATRQRQRLRAVEAARATIGPEISLRIVGGDRLADEKRQREVLVAIARREAEEHVVLVAVAIRAHVEHLARRGPGRREDLQVGGRRLQTTFVGWSLRATLIGLRATSAWRVLPRPHERDVRRAWTVTRLAPNPHFRPRSAIRVRRWIE